MPEHMLAMRLSHGITSLESTCLGHMCKVAPAHHEQQKWVAVNAHEMCTHGCLPTPDSIFAAETPDCNSKAAMLADWRQLTSLNGGVQLTQASSDFSIHLALPGRLLREGVPVCSVCLTDLHKQQAGLTASNACSYCACQREQIRQKR